MVPRAPSLRMTIFVGVEGEQATTVEMSQRSICWDRKLAMMV